jgi:hypothetical protein
VKPFALIYWLLAAIGAAYSPKDSWAILAFFVVAFAALIIHRIGVSTVLHRVGCFCFSARDGWNQFSERRRQWKEQEGL